MVQTDDRGIEIRVDWIPSLLKPDDAFLLVGLAVIGNVVDVSLNGNENPKNGDEDKKHREGGKHVSRFENLPAHQKNRGDGYRDGNEFDDDRDMAAENKNDARDEQVRKKINQNRVRENITGVGECVPRPSVRIPVAEKIQDAIFHVGLKAKKPKDKS